MASGLNGILIRRRLAAIAASFSAACFLAQYLIPARWYIPAALIFAVLSVFAFLYDRKRGAGLLLITAGLTAGFLWSFAFTHIYFVPAEALHGTTAYIRAEATDYSERTDYGVRVSARLTAGNGGAVKSLVYINDTELSLKPGDKIEMAARLTLSTRVSDVDGFTYFSSKGVFLLAYPDSAAMLEETDTVPPRYFPVVISKALRDRIEEIFSPDTAPLMKGILTGDRSDFSDYLTACLNDSGLSHIVVVSGMHLSFLVGMITTLTRKKKRAFFIAVPVMLVFMAMTGFTPSVTRAGVMQILALSAPLFKRDTDAPTALSFALMLILVVNPFAAASVSLQLSFASVAGIMLFTGRIDGAIHGALRGKFILRHSEKNGAKRDGRRKSGAKRDGAPGSSRPAAAAVKFVSASLSTTLGAMSFTLPLVCIYFGRVALVSPLSNLLALWAVSLVFLLGMAAAALSFIYMPIGLVLGYAALPFAKYLLWVIQKTAALPLASLNTSNIYFLAWFIYAYILIWVFVLCKRQRPLLFSCLAVCSLCAALLLNFIGLARHEATMAVLDVGQGQSVVIITGEYTILVDCGGNKRNAGDIAADYIKSLSRNKVDLVVLSHYHDDHANGIPELLSRLRVESVALPYIEEDADIRAELMELAAENGVSVIDVDSDMSMDFGGARISLYTSDFAYLTNEKGIIVLFQTDSFGAVMTGDINELSEKRLAGRVMLPDIDVLVAGHHGSKYSTSDELLEALTPEAAIISAGRNNYGHPSPETLEKLDRRAIEVYRTDAQGTITIKAGGGR